MQAGVLQREIIIPLALCDRSDLAALEQGSEAVLLMRRPIAFEKENGAMDFDAEDVALSTVSFQGLTGVGFNAFERGETERFEGGAVFDDLDHSSQSTRKTHECPASQRIIAIARSAVAWRMRKLQPPPLWTRQWPVGGPTGSVPVRRRIHCTIADPFPRIADHVEQSHGFGGYMLTGAVYS